MTRPNEEMIRYWNDVGGPRWVTHHAKLDAQIADLGLMMLDRLGIGAGQAVLDVGCGCGQTVMQIAERVGDTGRVVAVDISKPMLGIARRRAEDARCRNVELLHADMQTHPLPMHAFDRACSRFGVMFFEDPVVAFGNIRRALRPDGMLGFVCWRAREDNAWYRVPLEAAALHIDPPPPVVGPGPFALADCERLGAMLDGAGFREVSVEPLDADVALGGGLSLDDTVEFAQQLGVVAAVLDRAPSDAVRARALDAVRDALAPHATPDGVRLGAAAWLVTARPGAAAT